MEAARNQTITPSLRVRDIQKSLDFYTKTLGFQTSGRITRQNGKIAHVSVGFDSPLLMLSPMEYVRTWRTKENFINNKVGVGVEFYINLNETTTVDVYFNELKSKGVTVINEPKTEFWGDRIFSIRDPDGYALTFSKHIRDVTPESRSTSFDVTHFLVNLDLEQERS
jgi:uncharacterized glyoxalase superfamily protein PhnB